MSAQNHETERLLKRIRELEIEYQTQEKLKEDSLKALVNKLEAAQEKIDKLESLILISKQQDVSRKPT